MVAGHLENLSLIDDVDAGVARVRDVETAAVGDGEAQGRTHPLALRMPFRFQENRLIRAGNRGSEVAVVRSSRDVLLARQERKERARDGLNRNPARHLPRLCPPIPSATMRSSRVRGSDRKAIRSSTARMLSSSTGRTLPTFEANPTSPRGERMIVSDILADTPFPLAFRVNVTGPRVVGHL